MTVYTEHFTINSRGFTDIIDITQKVKSAVINITSKTETLLSHCPAVLLLSQQLSTNQV